MAKTTSGSKLDNKKKIKTVKPVDPPKSVRKKRTPNNKATTKRGGKMVLD